MSYAFQTLTLCLLQVWVKSWHEMHCHHIIIYKCKTVYLSLNKTLGSYPCSKSSQIFLPSIHKLVISIDLYFNKCKLKLLLSILWTSWYSLGPQVRSLVLSLAERVDHQVKVAGVFKKGCLFSTAVQEYHQEN